MSVSSRASTFKWVPQALFRKNTASKFNEIKSEQIEFYWIIVYLNWIKLN